MAGPQAAFGALQTGDRASRSIALQQLLRDLVEVSEEDPSLFGELLHTIARLASEWCVWAGLVLRWRVPPTVCRGSSLALVSFELAFVSALRGVLARWNADATPALPVWWRRMTVARRQSARSGSRGVFETFCGSLAVIHASCDGRGGRCV